MHPQSFSAFVDEMVKIGFAPMSFVSKGFGRLGRAFRAAPKGQTLSMTERIGGKGAVEAGGIGQHMKDIWRRGSETVGASGKPAGWLGGLRELAGSRYGQMGAAAGLTGLGAYGGYKAVTD